MRNGFVDKIPSLDGGTIAVRRRPGPSTGPIDQSAPPAGCNHTTETSIMPAAWGRGCPHIGSGPLAAGGRPVLEQYIAFGSYGTALENDTGGTETNRLIRCQIEIVAYSSLEPWLPKSAEHRSQLASFYEWAEQELGIPKRRPFPDRLAGGTVWATEANPRRRSNEFGREPGWYGHVEIDENSHWDPGSYLCGVLLRQEPEPRMASRYALVATWKGAGDHREARELTKNLTLKDLGRKMATDKDLRAKIRAHKDDKHLVHIARRRVEIKR